MPYEDKTEFVPAKMPGIAEPALRNRQLKIASRQAERQKCERLPISSHDNRNVEWGELLTELVHEMSQPLAAIVNYAGICAELAFNEQIPHEDLRDALTHIHQQAHRAGAIIGSFKWFTSSDTPRLSKIDLNKTVREVASIMRLSLQSHHALIRFRIESTLLNIWADAVQIQQVLVNLVQNALEAMDDIEPDRRCILVTAAKDSENVRVAVHDRGQGLSRDIMERIFDARFSTKANSLGVGLSISRRIIEQHGGWLWATANQGRGATFAFTLPISNPTSASGTPDCHIFQQGTPDMQAAHHRAN